jgi:hypothetical protein
MPGRRRATGTGWYCPGLALGTGREYPWFVAGQAGFADHQAGGILSDVSNVSLTEENREPMMEEVQETSEMETGWPLQLLRMFVLFSLACGSLAADSPSTPAAVLHANGSVKVNGSDSRKTTALFRGDSVQTNADSVANITAGGSSVLIMPDASVKFLGNVVEVDKGGVTIATSVGMAAAASGLTIAPAPGVQKPSRFEVAETEDSVIVAALEGNVAVSDGQQTSTTPEGQQTKHKKKKKSEGAEPAASANKIPVTTSRIPVRTIAIVTSEAALVAGASYLIVDYNTKKNCVSASGNKNCN